MAINLGSLDGVKRRGEATDEEPYHVFDERIRTRLDAVRAELRSAMSEAELLHASVSNLRTAVDARRATKNDLLAEQRALATTLERVEAAKLELRDAERWEASERNGRHDREVANDRAMQVEVRQRREDLAGRYAGVIRGFLASLEQLEREVEALNRRYYSPRNVPIFGSPVGVTVREDLERRARLLEGRS